MRAQVNTPKVADANVLFALLEEDMRAGVGKAGSLNARIAEVKRRFYEQGKREGYIDESLPVEVASLYADIFQAGYKALLADHGFSILTPSRPGYDDTPSSVGKTAQEAAEALAALLDTLQIPDADIIGISAAGPTALAFAQRYPGKIRKLILESAVTTPWDEKTKRGSRLVFGRAERITWGMVKLALRLAPMTVIRMMMQELTILDIHEVIARMSWDDLGFVRRMIAASRSRTGFMNDIEHRVNDLGGITAPVLVMYSPNDKAVPPKYARRAAAEITTCELYEVPSDTHLIWIGNSANEVWQKRLWFLNS